ncbi:hypothetical protein [Leifsonia poae]|uniref:hypothetical protein n=1 Tax=Leifsonia poae TaxID=110933 RepID=UPI001CBEF0BB|nr:hypothetical protein [Leifsonia poae]
MTKVATPARPFFPTSRAGALAGVALVIVALVTSMLQAAGVSVVSSTAVFIVLLAAFATIPRSIRPRGAGILAPIGQAASAAVYGSALAVGVAGISASAATGTPLWASIALALCTVGFTAGAVWAITSRHASPQSP